MIFERICYFLCLFGVIEVSVLSFCIIRHMIKHKDFDWDGYVLLLFNFFLFCIWFFPLIHLGYPKEETKKTEVIVKCYYWGTDDYGECPQKGDKMIIRQEGVEIDKFHRRYGMKTQGRLLIRL